MIQVPSLPSFCPLHKGRMMLKRDARTTCTCHSVWHLASAFTL